MHCVDVTLIIIYGAIIDTMYDCRMECKRYNNQEATTNRCTAEDLKLLCLPINISAIPSTIKAILPFYYCMSTILLIELRIRDASIKMHRHIEANIRSQFLRINYCQFKNEDISLYITSL